MYKLFFKRLFDVLGALIGLVILFPIISLLFILLTLSTKGKPCFMQKRPGKNEEIFTIFKFKTMNDKKDNNGVILPDTERLTFLGKFIRKTSLDEIPQLLNVLKGDMSFIGPRPLLIRYLPYYSSSEKKRHLIRPGITGLAQISGRNLLNWDERLKKDVEYVDNISFSQDLNILFISIKNVLTSKDIVVDPSSVMADLDNLRKLD
ncbi:sugar transferase [Algibacter sp. R77976]|uniref:sugar transferase n=1 Tax=Algibacter sp. R77976 TaxID=3093873 RepID=UPI0037C7642F